MSRQPEARLHVRIRDRLKKEVGGWWIKFWSGPFSQAGIPDILGCCEGIFFAFEVKQGNNEAEPIQVETIKRIRKIGGGVAAVVRSPEEAITLVKNRLRSARAVPKTHSKILPRRKNRRIVFRSRDRKDLGRARSN